MCQRCRIEDSTDREIGNGRCDDEFGLVVAIELNRSLGKRRMIEDELALTPCKSIGERWYRLLGDRDCAWSGDRHLARNKIGCVMLNQRADSFEPCTPLHEDYFQTIIGRAYREFGAEIGDTVASRQNREGPSRIMLNIKERLPLL